MGKLPVVQVKFKPEDPWESLPTRTVRALIDCADVPEIPVSRYGGRLDRYTESAGFFRTAKVGGRWWLIDPDGYLFLHKAVVSVRPGLSTSQVNRAALREKFGSPERWRDATVRMLQDHGFNGTGAWSDVQLLQGSGIAYTCMWNFMSAYGRKRGGTYQKPGHTGYPNDCMFVFDPQFEEFCDAYAVRLAQFKDDPFLLGHFSDNELPFPADLLNRYLQLDADDPGHQAAQTWLAKRRGVGPPHSAITDSEREAFREFVADRYFEITSRAIRKHDPNHLCLGSRFYGSEKRSLGVFRAAGRHLDVVSVNLYRSWTPDVEVLRAWENWSGRPIIITEWYAKGMDSGYSNRSGAGWIVPTQADRGMFYQNFVLALLESGVCPGWHWFKYMDNDPADLSTDPSNRDSNKGIVTIRFEPYGPLLDWMRELNTRVYALADHFDGGESDVAQ